LLVQLLGAGVTPVISPVSRGTSGGALNVNADDAASAVAVALGAEELLFLTDVDGVRAGGLVRSDLDVAEAASLVTSGEAGGGMAVKLDAATRAIEGGVPMVRIGGLGALTDRHAGTRVLARMAVVQCARRCSGSTAEAGHSTSEARGGSCSRRAGRCSGYTRRSVCTMLTAETTRC